MAFGGEGDTSIPPTAYYNHWLMLLSHAVVLPCRYVSSVLRFLLSVYRNHYSPAPRGVCICPASPFPLRFRLIQTHPLSAHEHLNHKSEFEMLLLVFSVSRTVSWCDLCASEPFRTGLVVKTLFPVSVRTWAEARVRLPHQCITSRCISFCGWLCLGQFACTLPTVNCDVAGQLPCRTLVCAMDVAT